MFVFTETRNIGQIGLNTYILLLFFCLLLRPLSVRISSSGPVCRLMIFYRILGRSVISLVNDPSVSCHYDLIKTDWIGDF